MKHMSQSVQASTMGLKSLLSTESSSPDSELSIRSKRRGKLSHRLKQRRQPWQMSKTRRNSESGELDSVESSDFSPIVDACTLCDMCFMTKCPYVPPHEFNLDFPHLMLRYRAAQLQRGEVGRLQRGLTETDRNGKLAGLAAPIANWAGRTDNEVTRPLLEKVAGVDRAAALPKFHGKTLMLRAMEGKPEVNREAPAFGRKVA